MKKYPKYRNTGFHWIGEVPFNWPQFKLKYISKIYTGNSLNLELKIKFGSNETDGKPYISTKDINAKNNDVNYNSGITIPNNELSYKIANPGSFLLCIEGGSAGKKIGFINQKSCFVNKLACFDYKNKYLYYFAQSECFINQFKGSITGLIGGVSLSSLKNFYAPFPSLKEQTQIAEYLDHKTELIYQIIEKKELLIKNLEKQRQAIINESVTKGLNPDAKMKDSGVEWLGEIPDHWGVCNLKYLARIRNGKDQKQVKTETGGYPILGTGGEFGRSLKYLYDKPSVLLGRKGTIDKPIYIDEPFWTVDTLFYTSIKSEVNPLFFYYLCKIIPFQLLQESSAVPSMTQDKLNNVSLVKVSLDEQKEIVKYVEENLSIIDKTILKLESQIQNMRFYRKSIISEAVTGKIDVRDWEKKTISA